MRGALNVITSLLLGIGTVAVAVPPQALAAPVSTVVTGAVVTGQVRSAGHLVAGAVVTLYAWPDPAVIAALKPGQQVPLKPVGSAVSSASGRYAIAVTRWSAVRAAASNDVVNLEVIAVFGRRADVFSFPRTLVAGPALATGQARALSLAPQRANLSLASGPAPQSDQPPCGYTYLIKRYRPRWVVVGATYSKVPGVSMSFTYGYGQNSSLGVGVSATSETSGFSENGTYSISTEASESWPTQRNAKSTLYKTEFSYGLYGVVCRGYQTKPTGWDAGAITGRPPRPKPPSACGSRLALLSLRTPRRHTCFPAE